MKKSAIIIFIKNPDLGRVKKRLAQSVGDNNALQVYRQMLAHTQQITQSLSTDKFLYYDREADTNDSWPNSVYHKKTQSGKVMASRINTAFKQIFKMGYEHIVMIGSDCLELDERIIRLAFRQLDHFDCVLGPTKDGGFYLMGLTAFCPELFRIIGWGTAQLMHEALRCIEHLNKTCFILPELADIATVDDLDDNLKLLII